jgi:plastocyanin
LRILVGRKIHEGHLLNDPQTPPRTLARGEGGNMRQPRLLATAIVLAAALTACGGSSDSTYNSGPTTNPGTTNPGGSTGASNSVVISDQAFNPGTVNVSVGTAVTWQWKDCPSDGYGGYATCVAHNITFDDGSNIASATQSSGTFSRTFNTAGTYMYHCAIHGSAMSGQVTVK